MEIARFSMQSLAGAALLVIAHCDVSWAQTFPTIFHGVWIVGVAENNACKAGDWDKHENDGLLKVDARDATYWESSCRVTAMRPSPWEGGPTVDLTMTCGGEGEISRAREIWSVVEVAGRKALVMTQLEASDSVPEGSKKTLSLRRSLSARVYLACE